MKRKPSGTLSATALRERIRGVEADILILEGEIDLRAQRRRELEIKLETLRELTQDMRPASENGKAKKPQTVTGRMLEHIRAHPGVRADDVVSLHLENPTAPDAARRRESLRQILRNQRGRGRLDVDATGKGLVFVK